MNQIEYKTWVSFLLSTLEEDDAQNIRNAVLSLTHDDDLSDPRVTELGGDSQGTLYVLKVPPDFNVMLQRPADSGSTLEIIDLVKDGALRSLQKSLSSHP